MQSSLDHNSISSTRQLLSPAEAEMYAAKNGILITAEDRARIANLQQAEMQRLQALNTAQSSKGWQQDIVASFNRAYPAFLKALVGIGDVMLTFSQTAIVAFGVPIVLILLLIVEQQRVVHGIGLFEVDFHLASFAAWAMVILNLIMEFLVHHVEEREGYIQQAEYVFSLRLWFNRVRYVIGFGDDWQPYPQSPAQRFRRILNLITFTILALALAGSMRPIIAQMSGAWYEALAAIVTRSTLAQGFTWLGGLLFAGAAVLSAQGLSRYVAIRCVEIVRVMRTSAPDRDEQINEALNLILVNYVTAKIRETNRQRRAGLVVDQFAISTPVQPFVQPNEQPVQAEQPVQLPVQPPVQSNEQPNKPKLQGVMDWLLTNDPNLEMRVRDVVAVTGASLGTVQEARNRMKQAVTPAVSSNGHGTGE